MMSIAATPQSHERQVLPSESCSLGSLGCLVKPYLGAALAFLVIAADMLLIHDLLVSRGASAASPAWLQAHNHAHIFGCFGTLMLGAAFCFAAQRNSVSASPWTAHICFGLWTAGVTLRLLAELYHWHWRQLLPASAALEIIAFAVFAAVAVRSRYWRALAANSEKLPPDVFILLGAVCGLALALTANLYGTVQIAFHESAPVLLAGLDTRFLMLCIWGFMAPVVWAISARALPQLMALKTLRTRLLTAACVLDAVGIAGVLAGKIHFAAVLLLHAAIFVPSSLRIFGKSERAVTDLSQPGFIRLAYLWLRVGATVGVWASVHDSPHIWAASRHLVTVGFIGTMIFALFDWAVAALSGTRLSLRPPLIFASLLLLNIGCPLHALAEILAGQGYVPWMRMRDVLPAAALMELCAVVIFAINVVVALVRLPQGLVPAEAAVEER